MTVAVDGEGDCEKVTVTGWMGVCVTVTVGADGDKVVNVTIWGSPCVSVIAGVCEGVIVMVEGGMYIAAVVRLKSEIVTAIVMFSVGVEIMVVVNKTKSIDVVIVDVVVDARKLLVGSVDIELEVWNAVLALLDVIAATTALS